MPHVTTEQLYTHFRQHPLVCTDTRNIQAGCLFFALKGASFNGNAFAAEALSKGAAYAVIDEEQFAQGGRFLLVQDVLKALQDLARYHRRQLSTKMIAVTGSNGKTTTKELLNAVLSQKYNVLCTQGNLNNHIGVPLTLLRLRPEHEIAVIEMGANHQGEIDLLCAIAEPDAGLITNVGLAHLEGFGGPEGVLKGKTELYRRLAARGGHVFVLADDERLLRAAAGIRQTTYGSSVNAQVRGRAGKAELQLSFSWQTANIPGHEVQTQLAGAYNLPNLLAAVTVGLHFGLSAGQIDAGIAGYVPSNNRSQLEKRGSNLLLLDMYNANPSSMRAALENFAAMKGEKKLLILGDMLELGEASAAEHQRIVDLLEEKKFSDVLLVGPEFQKTSDQIGLKRFSNSEEATDYLKKHRAENALVLVKGSRGIKLENVLKAF